MHLSEDDTYRRSTQFRYWSFTPTQIANQRRVTNTQASQRVQDAIALAHERTLGNEERLQLCTVAAGSDDDNDPSTLLPELALARQVDCLTVEEEQRLIDMFCQTALGLGQFLKFPIEVSATGVQYLRRFYLYNSPMTYDPKLISRSIMFFAAKTEGRFMTAEDYASKIPQVTPGSIVAPEFLIMQGLRFHLDVKHPFRGLKGGARELLEMARGNALTIPCAPQTPKELQREMLALPIAPGAEPRTMTQEKLEKRLSDAYALAKHVLYTTAVLTDVYFLYTPSQIWLSAYMLADEPVTLFYLGTKVPISSTVHSKLLSVLKSCSSMIYSHPTYIHRRSEDKIATEDAATRKVEIATLMRKLRKCTNPAKFDIEKITTAIVKKRGIEEVQGEEERRGGRGQHKKRRIEREDRLKLREEQVIYREIEVGNPRDDIDDGHRARFFSVPVCPAAKA